MESVGKRRSAGSAVLLLIIGSAISSGFPRQLGEGAVRRVRIVPSSTLISAKLLSRAVHAHKKDCKIFHPRASRKKNNSCPKNGSRNVAQKVVKHNNDNTSNPSSIDFLELRNLVTGMAAKLEMLEKKMDQGTPACQPTIQPAPPTMIYPTAPIPPPMMPLGVSRLPHHPIPFSHHSYY